MPFRVAALASSTRSRIGGTSTSSTADPVSAAAATNRRAASVHARKNAGLNGAMPGRYGGS